MLRSTIFTAIIALTLVNTHAQDNKSLSDGYRYVNYNENDHLRYYPLNNYGDRIFDYGAVGYKEQGLEALPDLDDLPVVAKVRKGMNLQKVINLVGTNVPVDPTTGFRGVINVYPGKYKAITIAHSGIVLRGIANKQNERPIIHKYKAIKGDRAVKIGAGRIKTDKASTVRISTYRVPSGSYTFSVENASEFEVGNYIEVATTPNRTWITDIKMHTEFWKESALIKKMRRRITDIRGNDITIDIPTTITIWKRHGGGQISKIVEDTRIRNVGIVNFHLKTNSAQKNFTVANGIGVGPVVDAFIQDITTSGFQKGAVYVNGTAERVTIHKVSYKGAGKSGGSQRYGYQVSGEKILLEGLTSQSARHAYVPNPMSAGGVVFKKSVSWGSTYESGGHQRYAGSSLWDNNNLDKSLAARRFRGPNINHGWRAVNNISWNTKARHVFQSPPHAYNRVLTSREIPSLHDAQLQDRYNTTIFEYILGDFDNYTKNRQNDYDKPGVDAEWKASFSKTMGFDTGYAQAKSKTFAATFKLDKSILLRNSLHILDAQLVVRLKFVPKKDETFYYLDDKKEKRTIHKTDFEENDTYNIDITDIADKLKDEKFNIAFGPNVVLDWAILRVKAGTGSKHIELARELAEEKEEELSENTVEELVQRDKVSAKLKRNPVNDILELSINTSLNHESNDIHIYNISGNLVKSLRSKNTDVNVFVGDLPKGIYIIHIVNIEKILKMVKL